MTTKVHIYRGIPGSGKSFDIKHVYDIAAQVVSADHYRIQQDGTYHFDSTQTALVHRQCLQQFDKWLRNDSIEIVVVDNTNIRAWEIAPYVAWADAVAGIRAEIFYVPCDPMVAARRNQHEVPWDTIFRMHRDLMREELPPMWKQHIVLPR